MSGYVTVKYVFDGSVPGEFFTDVYTPSHDARHLKVECATINFTGECVAVIVSAECRETIDWHLEKWLPWQRG